MKNKTFIQELINNVIPWLDELIEKEAKHYHWLCDQHEKGIDTTTMQIRSSAVIKHMQKRKAEYMEFAGITPERCKLKESLHPNTELWKNRLTDLT